MFKGFLLVLWLSAAFVSVVRAESITLVAEDDWYPYSAERNHQPVGMAVDIVRAVYSAAGVDLTLVSKPYGRCMAEVKAGKYPGCFDTSKDAVTEADYVYSREPLFYATFGIYARADQPSPVTIQMLEGKKVGLTNGYTYGLMEENAHFIRDYGPSDASNFRKLIAKRFDFAVVYIRVGDVLMVEYKDEFAGKIKLVGTTETIPLYVSFSKTHPLGKQASQWFDQGMKIIKSNGTYQKISAQWNHKYCSTDCDQPF